MVWMLRFARLAYLESVLMMLRRSSTWLKRSDVSQSELQTMSTERKTNPHPKHRRHLQELLPFLSPRLLQLLDRASAGIHTLTEHDGEDGPHPQSLLICDSTALKISIYTITPISPISKSTKNGGDATHSSKTLDP